MEHASSRGEPFSPRLTAGRFLIGALNRITTFKGAIPFHSLPTRLRLRSTTSCRLPLPGTIVWTWIPN